MGTAPSVCNAEDVGLLGISTFKDKVGGLYSAESGPSNVQDLQVKGGSCMTGQCSKGFAKGFMLGQPIVVNLKPIVEKQSSRQAKVGSRALIFGNLKKGLQFSQYQRENDINKEVCAYPPLYVSGFGERRKSFQQLMALY